MKLLTINVHAWQEENQIEKIQQLAQVIHTKRYDAIALQEVSQHRKSEIAFKDIRKDNYALILNEELTRLGSGDYELHWKASHYGYDVYEEGLALLVRHPAEDMESFYITQSTSLDFWKSRRIIGGTFLINNHSISLYSCHLGWWGDDDEPYTHQVDQLVLKASVHDRFVLLGDFNAPDDILNEGYSYLLRKGLYDTHQIAHTTSGNITMQGDIAGWEENKAGLKIDYIFTNWHADVKYSNIIFDGKKETVISDHFGIEIEIQL